MQLQHLLQIAVTAIADATVLTVAPLFRKYFYAVAANCNQFLAEAAITDTTVTATPFAK
jgi:hypothetical protein